jgi:Zn-dependent protease with chaperone function
MAIDFFDQQDQARRNTFRLFVYFILALVVLVALTYLLIVLVFHVTELDSSDRFGWWHPHVFLSVFSGVGLVVAVGSGIMISQLASGGKAVALLVGGQEIPRSTRELREKRLLNVVEEMSIASGVPVPPVYLLPDEAGINAFAAGYSHEDAVVAVSQGCLEYLTRDELQGVVAHEFSHILNGDMRLNIRLIGLVHGLIAVSLIGRMLLNLAGQSRPSRSSSDRNGDDRSLLVIMGLGFALLLLGLLGSLLGNLIKAAISRQREYLADASAVQFTRNPDGIGGALKKIGGLAAGSRMKNPRAEEVSHMFLANALSASSLSSLFDTHPPLGDRIRRVDPNFDGKYPVVRPVTVTEADIAQESKKRLPPLHGIPSLPGLPQVPIPVLGLSGQSASSVGQVTPESVREASSLDVNIPEVLREAAAEPFAARAVVYCLLLDPQHEIRTRQLAALQAEVEPRDYAETLRLLPTVEKLDPALRLPLVELAVVALRTMSPRQYQTFSRQIDVLIAADKQVSLFEYALRTVVTSHLDRVFVKRPPSGVRYRSPQAVVPHLTKVMSLLAWTGQTEEPAAQRAFEVGLKAFDAGPVPPLLPRAQCSLADFDRSLHELADALPQIKRRVVSACEACILARNRVTVRQSELFRATCALLDCPLPPLSPNQPDAPATSNV